MLAEIGAAEIPEIVVINKSDAADPMVLARLQAREPHALVCSVRTGDGMADVVAAVEAELPRPQVEVRVLLPYGRGDLLNQIHTSGEVLELEHTGEGTAVVARVSGTLAGALATYATAAT